MAAKLKIEKKGDEILIVQSCFSISFSVKYFFQPKLQLKFELILTYTKAAMDN
jgi:hypothetical protein